MCGIAGYIGKFPPGLDNLNQTSKILNHRGPDGKVSIITNIMKII